MPSKIQFLAAYFLIFSIAVSAAPQSTDGKNAQITPKFRSALKKGNVRIVVPTYVPQGFKLVAATIEPEKEIVMRDVYLRYEKPKSKSFFYIQFASDGIGDPFFDLANGDTLEANGSIRSKNAIFGAFDLDYVNKKPHLMWHITWAELKQKGYPRYVLVGGENMPVSEGKKIIESLAWLK